MSDHDRHDSPSPPVLDIGAALELLTDSVDVLRGGCGIPPDRRPGEVPAGLTLGALAVLRAAQRAEERGLGHAEALAYANTAASRYVDLLPDGAFAAALSPAASE